MVMTIIELIEKKSTYFRQVQQFTTHDSQLTIHDSRLTTLTTDDSRLTTKSYS